MSFTNGVANAHAHLSSAAAAQGQAWHDRTMHVVDQFFAPAGHWVAGVFHDVANHLNVVSGDYAMWGQAFQNAALGF